MHGWKFMKRFARKKGVTVVKCLRCHQFIGTEDFGDLPKISKTRWDLCERCQNKERGFIGAKDDQDLAIR